MALNEFQEVCARTYAGGEFRYMIDQQPGHAQLRVMLLDCGDSLFRALMLELSDTEDGGEQEEAERRLQTIIREATEVLEALQVHGEPSTKS